MDVVITEMGLTMCYDLIYHILSFTIVSLDWCFKVPCPCTLQLVFMNYIAAAIVVAIDANGCIDCCNGICNPGDGSHVACCISE